MPDSPHSIGTWPLGTIRRSRKPPRTRERCCDEPAIASLPIATAVLTRTALPKHISAECARSATSSKGNGSRRDNAWIKSDRSLVASSAKHHIIARVNQPYVPLRVFSSFTMLEGAMEPKTVAERAAKLGFPAIAVTDRNGLYGVMPFSDACVAKGVQPIIGAMLAVARPPDIGGEAAIDWLVLLAKDDQGYANLCKLVSSAHLDRPLEQEPHVEFAKLEELGEGLIALTAGAEGAVARLVSDGQVTRANAYLDRLQTAFPNRLYIEISRRGDLVEEASEAAFIDLAYARDLPLVATNPASYADPSFHAAHDAMLCIANSAYVESADRVSSSADAWLKDGAVMAELFADLPEALANTAVIAQRCAVAAPKRRPIFPRLGDDEDEQLRADAIGGLEKPARRPFEGGMGALSRAARL